MQMYMKLYLDTWSFKKFVTSTVYFAVKYNFKANPLFIFPISQCLGAFPARSSVALRLQMASEREHIQGYWKADFGVLLRNQHDLDPTI